MIGVNCKMRKIILIMILILTILPLAKAFGATPPYSENNPLILSPNEEKEISILLQNMIGNKDIKLKAEITEGKEIATLADAQSYTISFGKKDIPVNIKIKIPRNAKKADKYQISISFTQIPENDEKMLQLTPSITTSFPIIIEELAQSPKISQNNISLTIITILIVMLIIIISIILSLNKKQTKSF